MLPVFTTKSHSKSKIKCETCGSERPPTLLHKELKKDIQDDEVTSAQTQTRNDHANANTNYSCSKIVLLKVFQQSNPLNTRKVYAIIDEQSNASMISPELVDELGIDGPKGKYLFCGRAVDPKKRSLVVESLV